ncbi:hypothetical protein HZH68_007072 [Vespula germanica]|uniref:Uncharacterized protein n=1 Tax=Vespula germanica TaxID=30212 RepID=A0A834N9L1_VESGE|nr:hypothetical protein HZH68_007072 [Vespula germanica]
MGEEHGAKGKCGRRERERGADGRGAKEPSRALAARLDGWMVGWSGGWMAGWLDGGVRGCLSSYAYLSGSHIDSGRHYAS